MLSLAYYWIKLIECFLLLFSFIYLFFVFNRRMKKDVISQLPSKTRQMVLLNPTSIKIDKEMKHASSRLEKARLKVMFLQPKLRNKTAKKFVISCCPRQKSLKGIMADVHFFFFFFFLNRGILLSSELPWPENLANTCTWHTETLDSCFNLISSVYCDLPDWRSNQQPQNAEPKLYHIATNLHCTQVMPNQLVMWAEGSVVEFWLCILWLLVRSPVVMMVYTADET